MSSNYHKMYTLYSSYFISVWFNHKLQFSYSFNLSLCFMTSFYSIIGFVGFCKPRNHISIRKDGEIGILIINGKKSYQCCDIRRSFVIRSWNAFKDHKEKSASVNWTSVPNRNRYGGRVFLCCRVTEGVFFLKNSFLHLTCFPP